MHWQDAHKFDKSDARPGLTFMNVFAITSMAQSNVDYTKPINMLEDSVLCYVLKSFFAIKYKIIILHNYKSEGSMPGYKTVHVLFSSRS